MNILFLLTPKTKLEFLYSDSTIRQAMEKVDLYKYSVLPLINRDGTYAGTISEGDLIRFIKNECNFDIKKAESVKLTDVPKYRPYEAVSVDVNLDDLVNTALNQNFIPIIDDRNMFIGIVKRKEIILHYYNQSNNENK